MLPVENNFNKIGLPHVYIALFRCPWIPGGGLEPFSRVLRAGGWLPLKETKKQNKLIKARFNHLAILNTQREIRQAMFSFYG